MPIYEYRCQECKSIFEEMRSMSRADEPAICTNCGGEHARRIISLVVAHSKGGSTIAGGSSCGSCASHACSTCGSR